MNGYRSGPGPWRRCLGVATAAAFWLAGTAVAASGAGPAADAFGQAAQQAVAAHLPAAIARTRDWVRYRSITTADDSYRPEKTALLRRIVADARAMGFSSRLVADDRAALIDLGDTSDPERTVGVLVHADVVPAPHPERWSHPPFAAEMDDRAIYGRGAADDKGPIAATLEAMAIVRDLRLDTSLRGAGSSQALGMRGVRMIVGSSEENLDWDDLEAIGRAGLAPAQGWTADAAFPVINAEKSFLNLDLRFAPCAAGQEMFAELAGGAAANVVAADARTVLRPPPDRFGRLVAALREQAGRLVAASPGGKAPQFDIKEDGNGGIAVAVRGQAAHGSRPQVGVNALASLALVMGRAGMLDGLHCGIGGALAFIADRLAGASDGSRLGIARRDPVMGGTTVNLGVAESLPDSRGQGILLQLNIRAPRGLPVADQVKRVVAAAQPFGAEGQTRAARDALWVDPDTPLVAQLQAAYSAVTGKPAGVRAIGGTTYAKVYPGYVAFGMGFPGQSEHIHAPNEQLLIDNLRRGMLIYVHALWRVLQAPTGGQMP